MNDPATFTILDVVRGSDLAILVIGLILIVTLFVLGLKNRRDSNRSKVFAALVLLIGCSLSIFQIAQLLIKVGASLFHGGISFSPDNIQLDIGWALYFLAIHLMIVPFSMVLTSILIIIRKDELG